MAYVALAASLLGRPELESGRIPDEAPTSPLPPASQGWGTGQLWATSRVTLEIGTLLGTFVPSGT